MPSLSYSSTPDRDPLGEAGAGPADLDRLDGPLDVDRLEVGPVRLHPGLDQDLALVGAAEVVDDDLFHVLPGLAVGHEGDAIPTAGLHRLPAVAGVLPRVSHGRRRQRQDQCGHHDGEQPCAHLLLPRDRDLHRRSRPVVPCELRELAMPRRSCLYYVQPSTLRGDLAVLGDSREYERGDPQGGSPGGPALDIVGADLSLEPVQVNGCPATA
jgi:hypothetical protein